MEREPDHRVHDKKEARRQAYQMNTLVDEGVVSSTEASHASAAEFDAILKEKFEPKYWQSLYHPEKVDRLRKGQMIEREAIRRLEEALPALDIGARIERATVEEDEGAMQDAHLIVDGLGERIHLQMTTKTGNEAEKKAAELAARFPETTFVVIPAKAELLTHGKLVGVLLDALRHNHHGTHAYEVLMERIRVKYPRQAAAFLQ